LVLAVTAPAIDQEYRNAGSSDHHDDRQDHH
jgi:hypothetical protein